MSKTNMFETFSSGQIIDLEASPRAESNVFLGTAGYVIAFNSAIPPSELWRLKISNPPVVLPTLCGDGTYLYVGAQETVLKIDTREGSILWSQPIKKKSEMQCELSVQVAGHYIICGGYGQATCLRKDTGLVVWNKSIVSAGSTGGYHPTTALVNKKIVYVAAAGTIYALALENGKKIWKTVLDKKYNLNGVTMRYCKTSKTETIECGTSGSLVVLDIEGRMIRDFQLHSNFISPVAQLHIGKYIFLASHGAIYCLDKKSHQRVWKNPLKGFGYSLGYTLLHYISPESEESILLVGVNRFVIALNVYSGEKIWATNLPNGTLFVSLLIHNNVIYYGSNGHFYGLSPDSGKILFHDKMKGLKFNPVTLATLEDYAEEHYSTFTFTLELMRRTATQ